MLLRHFKIGQRTFAGFAVALLMMLGLGLFSLAQMDRIADNSIEIAENWLPATRALGELQAEVNYFRSQEVLLVNADNSSEIARAEQGMTTSETEVRKYLERYEQTIAAGDEKDRQLFQQLARAWQDYLSTHAELQTLAKNGQQLEAEALLEDASRDRLASLRTAYDTLADFNRDGARAARQRSESQAAQAETLVWAGILVALVVTLGVAIVLTRSITAPLRGAVAAAGRIADNDLTESLRVDGKDEIAELQQALVDMQQSLRSTLQQVTGAATQLASAAEELNAVTEDSTQGLTTQNSEIQMAATAVTEMSVAIEEVARHANDTSEASRAAQAASQQGRAQVGQTRHSIVQLSGAVTDTGQNIQALVHQTAEITKVLDVIGAIADQTNLLALNAAIEAARAGEQGRGFSVVADEVRALAHRTQQSTREIAGMIEGVQSVTQKAVEAMNQSQEQTGKTLSLAEAADQALEEIARMVARINEMNLSIASASEQQAQVSREVDQNLVNIRDVADQNAAGAQQTTAASQELARLASDLNGMVTNFKL